jgi:hypothetical protein
MKVLLCIYVPIDPNGWIDQLIKPLLPQLINYNEKARKKHKKEASADELKSLIEILYNLRELPLSTEEAGLQLYRKPLHQFVFRKLAIGWFKTFSYNNQILPSVYLFCVNFLTLVFCNILDHGTWVYKVMENSLYERLMNNSSSNEHTVLMDTSF